MTVVRDARGRTFRLALALAAVSAASLGQGRGGPHRPAPTPAPGAPERWQVLGIEQAVTVEGRIFPPRPAPPAKPPEPRRTFHASVGSPEGGDGSAGKPWGDLQAALRFLEPGDRLVVGKGNYGSIRIGETCRDGKPGVPVEVVGDGAVLRAPSGGSALVITRSSWRLSGFRISRGEKAGPPLVVVAGSARDIALGRLRVEPGGGPAVSIEAGARQIVLSESTLRGRVDVPSSGAAVGVNIGAGDRDITIEGVTFSGLAGPAVRIGGASEDPPRNVTLSGDTFLNLPGPAVWVLSAETVRIADCQFMQLHPSRVGRGEALRIEGGREIVTSESRFRDWALALRVGLVEASGGRAARPEQVVFERSYVESRIGSGTGAAVEAGTGVRISNDIFDGLAEGVLLFGHPPQTADVTVANNLILGVASLAFQIEDPASSRVFDHNVFTAAKEKVSVEVRGKTSDLARYLAENTVPGSKVVPSVRFLLRDLSRVEGVDVVDRGRPLPNVSFQGKAPDLGVAER